MEHGEHIFVWSRRRTVSSCRINILRSPDHYNRRMVYKQVWAGLECMPILHACTMRRRPDIQHNNYFFSYKFKIVNKEKSSITGKLNQWWKQRRLSTCMILNCTSLNKKKGHKQDNKKISIEIKRM